MKKLEGKIAVVTGAGRGIGAAIARALGGEGAFVYCIARSADEVSGVAKEIIAGGGQARAVQADIADADSLARLYGIAGEEKGGLDILVANAGMSGQRDVPVNSEKLDIARWRQIIEVNLFGTYDSIRLAVPLMTGRGGSIIVTGSGAGHFPIGGMSAYCSSKAGLWMLVRTLAEELRPLGLSINELIPGPVETEMMKRARSERADASAIMAQEWMKTPDDVVPLAMFLATQPAGAGPTGQSFRLNRRPL